MNITILYFSWIKEKIGTGEDQVTTPVNISNVQDLIDWLRTQSPAHTEALSDVTRIRVAVDQKVGTLNSEIKSNSEVAFFPPVTGG